MTVIIVGAGIGGLTAALSLHQAGIEVHVFEQARELAELGVGINLLPHATKELAALGLLPALDEAGIRTRELIYATRFGQIVWRELRGTSAGYQMPQFSIHRGKLHGVLARAAAERLGATHLHTGCALVGFEDQAEQVVARLERRGDRQRVEVAGDALVGCDGIHSTVRATLYPNEGPPVWSGIMMWRGAVFRLTEVDPAAIIQATDTIYEYPNCDRDPLPRWSFGRVTLLGDAAHPMYPVGSNGASQAILDARALARHVTSGESTVDALAAYDAERRPVTGDIVMSNRQGGSEGVIDVVEARAPEGFDNIEAVATHAELQTIVSGYARLAGYSAEQVNRR